MERDKAELWYETNLDIFLNRWYANYEEARAGLEKHGGFLLPYRHHFFVCQADVIQALGLDKKLMGSGWGQGICCGKNRPKTRAGCTNPAASYTYVLSQKWSLKI